MLCCNWRPDGKLSNNPLLQSNTTGNLWATTKRFFFFSNKNMKDSWLQTKPQRGHRQSERRTDDDGKKDGRNEKGRQADAWEKSKNAYDLFSSTRESRVYFPRREWYFDRGRLVQPSVLRYGQIFRPTDPAISTWITHGKFMCCQAIYMALLEGLLPMLHMGDPRDN